jgi:hypothetical protein
MQSWQIEIEKCCWCIVTNQFWRISLQYKQLLFNFEGGMLDIHSFPYAKLDVGEEHSLKNSELSVSLKMQYGTAFEQVLIKQSRCWNYCIPSDCTSAAEMAERPVLFVSNFPSWVHGFGRVCDSGEVLAILCCLNALRFVDLWFF